jgi:hypothetical protein
MWLVTAIDSTFESAYRHARASRLVLYALLGIPFLNLFPLAAIALAIPSNDAGDFTARTEPLEPTVAVLYAMTLTAAFVVNALLSAGIFGTTDCELFPTTPLTWGLCLRRQLANGWTFLASSFLAVPLAICVVWIRFDLTTMTGGLRWSGVAIVDALLAHAAIGLGAIALSVRQPWREIGSKRVHPSIGVLRGTFIVGPFLLMLAFWREVYGALKVATVFALGHGPVGELAIGLFTPASFIALELIESGPRPAGHVLRVLWLILVGMELRSIVRRFRIEELPRAAVLGAVTIGTPSAKCAGGPDSMDYVEMWPAAGKTPIQVRREPLNWPVWIQRHVADRTMVSGDEAAYDISRSPEVRFVRTLTYLSVSPKCRSFVGAIAIFGYRYPWFLALILVFTATLAGRWFGSEVKTIAAITMIAAYLVNFYGGIRWMRPLRVSLALPLRLNRLCLHTWLARLKYGMVVDGVCAVLCVQVFSWGWVHAILVFLFLQVVRVCGQIRSWLSICYGAGRKLGSWLYEVPLMSGPLLILTAIVLIDPDTSFQLALIGSVGVLAWIPYGFFVLWLTSRDNDSSVIRATSSYRRGDPANESI